MGKDLVFWCHKCGGKVNLTRQLLPYLFHDVGDAPDEMVLAARADAGFFTTVYCPTTGCGARWRLDFGPVVADRHPGARQGATPVQVGAQLRGRGRSRAHLKAIKGGS